ncbi:hypothetical protein [Azospirillum sp. TSH100]|uniref:hypothetical protein n=1 Tax=Azospirillum sp. TSH100 TaxID=652764 RepID=UPI0010AA8A56|nr:hypothetical protein [Azospirillum sp. TSH100]QCG86703.1 hypothetical protein E6C72_02515 [Azospirillum sp. TSH100]
MSSLATRYQVFVAYAYSLYPKEDYRKVFTEIEANYPVSFIFADEKITNMHIMQKIISYIKSSTFSVFDISGWNANVTLELGFAMATSENWYIAHNPKHTPTEEVPSDIRGIDRIQYTSLTELAGKLLALMDQRFPKITPRGNISDHIESMQTDLITLLRRSPGMKIAEIADILKVDVKLAQVVVAPLIGELLESTGTRKGTRYYLKGMTPK